MIIAEIGTSHGGDLAKARDLISAAAEAGADAAKFQLVIADEILHPLAGPVDLPGGRVPLYEIFKGLERPPEFYAELKALAEKKGMLFICSPFGKESARILRDIGTEVFKIASPELNHIPLLREIASYKKPVILSSGVSTLGDIERALDVFRPATSERAGGGPRRKSPAKAGVSGVFPPVGLLHCVTSYPAPEEEYNLRLLPNLAAVFGVPAGVSDHSLDPILVPVLAVLQGARYIEKHFTLERTGGGLDDPVALPPEEFARMVREIRVAETELSAGRASVVIEALEAAYGAARVEWVLGDGIKRLAPSEAANYSTTNRSLHALKDIAAGEILSEINIGPLRSEKNLRPGLPPELWEFLLGRRAVRNVPSGEGLLWDDLIPARGEGS
jgi:N-acetylneuraminate synthase